MHILLNSGFFALGHSSGPRRIYYRHLIYLLLKLLSLTRNLLRHAQHRTGEKTYHPLSGAPKKDLIDLAVAYPAMSSHDN